MRHAKVENCEERHRRCSIGLRPDAVCRKVTGSDSCSRNGPSSGARHPVMPDTPCSCDPPGARSTHRKKERPGQARAGCVLLLACDRPLNSDLGALACALRQRECGMRICSIRATLILRCSSDPGSNCRLARHCRDRYRQDRVEAANASDQCDVIGIGNGRGESAAVATQVFGCRFLRPFAALRVRRGNRRFERAHDDAPSGLSSLLRRSRRIWFRRQRHHLQKLAASIDMALS